MWTQDDRDNKIKPALPTEASAPGNTKSNDGSDMRAAQFGRSLYVKGEVTGAEDATILADVTAKVVTIFGSISGSVTAKEKVDIRKGGSVEGGVTCARLAVQDGAILTGKFETQGARSSRARTSAIGNAA
jgi:cytoskeletal protein CcmA (bactofilin family)